MRRGRAAPALIAIALLLAAVVVYGYLRRGAQVVQQIGARTPLSPAAATDPHKLVTPGPAGAADGAGPRTALAPEPAQPQATTEARPHGVVIDASTREPLPAYLIGAYSFGDSARRSLWTTSDAKGEFRFDTEVPFGKLRFELVDDRGLAYRNNEYVTVAFAPAADGAAPPAIQLAAVSGPTCFFELELPAGLFSDDFEASLLGARPFQGSPYTSDPVHATLRPPHAATLHPTLPWVRFGAPFQPSGPAFVALRSADSRWQGGHWIEASEGLITEPIKIAFESATWLHAQVAMPAGLESNVAQFRLLERLPEHSKQRPRMQSASCGADGNLHFDFLEPGEYRLFTHDYNWYPFEREVSIVRGANDLGTIELAPRPVVGDIRGTIESKSGKYEGACHVSLSNTPFEHDALYDHSLDFEDDGTGRMVAPIEIENVTAGEWFLYVHCHDGFVHTQSLRTVVAPDDNVRIVLDDTAASIEIELVDAPSGAPLGEDSELNWRCGDNSDLAYGPHIRLEGLPDAPERFSFMATAPGYRPQRGTAADFERVPAGESSAAILRATCKLEPGFGGLIRARDRSSYSPIEGAQIFIDNVLAGQSDADGEFWLALAQRPERVRVEKPGWRWLSTPSVNAKNGHLNDGPEYYVDLVRED